MKNRDRRRPKVKIVAGAARKVGPRPAPAPAHRFDPSRVGPLANRFAAALVARFRAFRRKLVHLVAVEDAFGLKRKNAPTRNGWAPEGGWESFAIAFNAGFRPDQKRDARGRWVREAGAAAPTAAPSLPSAPRSLAETIAGLRRHPLIPKYTLSSEGLTLRKVGNLGGSTGAELYVDEHNYGWVVKRGDSKEHREEEVAADRMYRAMGVPVPYSEIRKVDGREAKVAPYLRLPTLAEELSKASADDRRAILAEVRKGFVADALLGNWDAAGLDHDNMLVEREHLTGGKPTRVWRIDNGGSLRFRAQGARKPEGAFGPAVTEIDTLRNPQINSSASEVYGDVTPAEMSTNLATILGRLDEVKAATPPTLRPVIAARLEDLVHRLPTASRETAWSVRHLPGPNLSFPKESRPSLSDEEAQAVADYTLSGFFKLNQVQRGLAPSTEETTTLDEHLEGIFRSLHPFRSPVKVNRGMDLDKATTKAFVEGARVSLETGEPIVFKSYLSTTSHPEIPSGPYFGGNVSLEMDVNYGLDVKTWSATAPEGELLVDKHSRFVVTKIDNLPHDDSEPPRYRIHMRQVNDAPTYAAHKRSKYPGSGTEDWIQTVFTANDRRRSRFVDYDLVGIVLPARPAPKEGFGAAGRKHPLKGKARTEQLKFLDRAARSTKNDTLNVRTGPPAGLDMRAFTANLLGALYRHWALFGVPAPLPSLYDAAGRVHNLSKHSFLRAVAALGRAGKLDAIPWARPLDLLPDPEVVLNVGGRVVGAVAPRWTDAATTARGSLLGEGNTPEVRYGPDALPDYPREWAALNAGFRPSQKRDATGKWTRVDTVAPAPPSSSPAPKAPGRALYTGVKLAAGARARLLKAVPVPEGWTAVAHHMTIDHPARKGFRELGEDEEGRGDTLRVTHVARDDRVLAVRVSPSRFASRNDTAHITIATNPAAGGKPVHSNELTDWVPLKRPFTVRGVATTFRAGATHNTRWSFDSTPVAVDAFAAWLRETLDAELLGSDAETLWRAYVEDGFRKGAGHAFDEAMRVFPAGSGPDDLPYEGGREAFLRDSFAVQETADKAKLLAGRTFADIKGLTDVVATTLRRVLTDGLVQGKNPLTVAKELAAAVDTLALPRARTIARTEMARAAAEGQLVALNKLGASGVTVDVEWSTTGDAKVCPKCKKEGGRVFSLDEAKGRIPHHPNCFVSPKVRIYTSRGWKPIGGIKSGDLVLTHKGRFRRVTHLHRNFTKNQKVVDFCLTFGGTNYQILITSNHPILINGEWKIAEELKPGDSVRWMADSCRGCGSALPYGLKYCGVHCQWQDPLHRELVSGSNTQSLLLQYVEGRRDRYANTVAANDKMREMLATGWRPRRSTQPASEETRRKISESKRGERNPLRQYPSVGIRNAQLLQEFLVAHPEKHPNRIMALRGHKTDIERKMEAGLLGAGIPHEFQHYSAGLWIDFAIVEHRIAIECDGEYWHRDPEAEVSRDARLEAEGWTVLHFPGKQITNNLSGCINEVIRVLKNHNGEYLFADFEVKEVKTRVLKTARLYNFSVEEDESYVAKGLVVHNCRCAWVPATFAPPVEETPAPPQVQLVPNRARILVSNEVASPSLGRAVPWPLLPPRERFRVARVLGAERLDLVGAFSARLATLNEDCGTGDGGFKPGNDCAKGGGDVVDAEIVPGSRKDEIVDAEIVPGSKPKKKAKSVLGGWWDRVRDDVRRHTTTISLDSLQREAGRTDSQLKTVEDVKAMMRDISWDAGRIKSHNMTSAAPMKALKIDGMKMEWDADSEDAAAKTLHGLIHHTRMPQTLWSAQDSIVFTSQGSSNEEKWRKDYHLDKDAQTLATGGFRGVTVYHSLPMDPGEAAHEMGHNLAQHVWKIETPPPDSDYAKAAQREPPVSEYGGTHPAEDFAEACRLYVTERDSFKRNFPAKYKAIRALVGE